MMRDLPLEQYVSVVAVLVAVLAVVAVVAAVAVVAVAVAVVVKMVMLIEVQLATKSSMSIDEYAIYLYFKNEAM